MKEHFEKYNDICRQIIELEYKVQVIENKLYGVKGVDYDFMPKGTPVGDMTLHKIIERDELVNQINDLRKQKNELYDIHIKEISKVDDERYRSVLRCYYLLGLSIEDIAHILNVSINHALKMRKKAIYEFMIKNDNK